MRTTSVDDLDGDGRTGQLFLGGTVALGFFDGCHLGHQAILRQCQVYGRDKAAVLTFAGHPGTVIPGRQAPKLLTTTPERLAMLQGLGLQVFLKTFDREFSTWSAERFVEEILVEHLGVQHVVVGHDYRFGHRAAGDVTKLAVLGRRWGFETTVVPAVTWVHDGETLVVSSTKIRQAVAEGEFELATHLLTRPYAVTATVVSGERRGRQLGFPTANLEFPETKVEPPYGVMAVRIGCGAGVFFGVANFGVRPTIGDGRGRPLLEVHLFDYAGDLYGQELHIEFLSFLRHEKRFDGLEALSLQIGLDVKEAQLRVRKLL